MEMQAIIDLAAHTQDDLARPFWYDGQLFRQASRGDLEATGALRMNHAGVWYSPTWQVSVIEDPKGPGILAIVAHDPSDPTREQRFYRVARFGELKNLPEPIN